MENLKKYQNIELIDLKRDPNKVFIIAPGASGGLTSNLIKNINQKLTEENYSVVSFNFSFQTNKTNSSESGLEEFGDIEKVYKYILENYPNAEKHLIGKSLGGIMCSWLAKKYPKDIKSVCILGYIPKHVDFGNFDNKLLVIQGQKDKFGDIKKIEESTKKLKTKNTLIEIKNADHSYKLENGKDKILEVSKHLISWISK